MPYTDEHVPSSTATTADSHAAATGTNAAAIQLPHGNDNDGD